MRKIAVLGLVLLVVSLLMVECGGAPASTATQPGAAAKAGGEKTATIGFTTSQTGSLNVESVRQTNGLNLWVEQVNAKGGIKAGFQHVATIPNIVIAQWRKLGVDIYNPNHTDKIRALLRDPVYRHLRTTLGDI